MSYKDKRLAEQRLPCENCGQPDDKCTESVLSNGRACCSVCSRTDSHPKRLDRIRETAGSLGRVPAPDLSGDPREGKAQAVQGSMFNDPASIEAAPVKPYAGGHGDAGGNRQTDHLGATQAKVLGLLEHAAGSGATVKEIREAYDEMHHGTVSGALSELHKGGIICRLATKRARCSVYVTPDNVDDRVVIPPKPTKAGLAARVMSANEVMVDQVEHVRYNGHNYYLASDLLEALMEGYGA